MVKERKIRELEQSINDITKDYKVSLDKESKEKNFLKSSLEKERRDNKIISDRLQALNNQQALVSRASNEFLNGEFREALDSSPKKIKNSPDKPSHHSQQSIDKKKVLKVSSKEVEHLGMELKYALRSKKIPSNEIEKVLKFFFRM